jgi:hypothetical protein
MISSETASFTMAVLLEDFNTVLGRTITFAPVVVAAVGA